MESRKQRFASSSGPVGLVSRGDDTLRDVRERRRLELTLKGKVEKYDVVNSDERDSILMGYRQLREGVIAGDADDEEVDRVYGDSARFAVRYGASKDYLPILLSMLEKSSDKFATDSLAIHLAFVVGDLERAIAVGGDNERIVNAWICGDVFACERLLIGMEKEYGCLVERALVVVREETDKGAIAYRGKEVAVFKEWLVNVT